MTIYNLFATSPGYWFRQKTLYSDFELLLTRFCALQILYTIAFVFLGFIFVHLWLEEHKKRKNGKFFTFNLDKENLYLISTVSMVLLIVGTWLGR